MALKKKDPKGQVATKTYPAEFVTMVDEAARFSVTCDYFDDRFKESKKGLQSYIEADGCPFEIVVGEKGSNPKIDGVGTLIVSQPERLNNKLAAAKIVALLQSGGMQIADLLEVVSQVNREALEKIVGAEAVKDCIAKNEAGELPLQLSLRVAASYKDEITANLDRNFRPAEKATA